MYHCDSYSDAHPNSDADVNAYPDSDAVAHTHANADTHTDSDAVAHSHANTDVHPDTRPYANADSYTYPGPDTYANAGTSAGDVREQRTRIFDQLSQRVGGPESWSCRGDRASHRHERYDLQRST